MPRKTGNSAKAEQDMLRERMRGYGCSMPQIAAEMARRFNLRPRVAWRCALGWPQWKVAQRYNTVHSGARLSDSRVGAHENWPHGGIRPSLRYLANLAATFGHGCTPDQLVDADDLDQLTPADRCLLVTSHPSATGSTDASGSAAPAPAWRDTLATRFPAGQPGGELVVSADPAVWAAVPGLPLHDELAPLLTACLRLSATSKSEVLTTARGLDWAYHQLVHMLTSWAHLMKRRVMLRTLGWAATAASVGYSLDPDEQARIAAVLSNSGRVDMQTIEHIEAVLWHCSRQDDALGPHAVLDTVLAQRQLGRALLPHCPAELRPRLLSAVSNASRKAGWLSFDLNDFSGATYHYERARALAHDAENVELGAFVLCQMSHLATWQGTPRIGIDHAVAAMQWANRTGDLRLQAYSADVAARAYAADGQRDACLTALDTAHAMLTSAGDQAPGYMYFYDEALHISIRGLCHLELRDGQRAVDYTQQSLSDLDQSFTRNVAFTKVDLGMAQAQCDEVDEAARLLGDAGEIAAWNTSARLVERLRQGRADLQPWADTTAVRTLDDRLTTYGLA